MAALRPWLLVLFAWAWLYLPCLGVPELHHEEGRRAGTAREMLSRGDFAMPVFQGQAYLQKPPGYYWILMGASRLLGGFSEWSIRLPSAISVLICAWLAGMAVRAFGGHALVAGMAMLIMPEVWGKGQLGEIDAVFMAQVFAAILLAWRAAERPRDRVAALAAGLLLGWAIITKGPAAPALFYLALVTWLVWEWRARWFISLQHLCIVVAAAAVVGLWAVFLARRMDLAHAGHIWASEVGAGRFEETAVASMKAFFSFPFGVLGGLLPGTLALIWLVLRRPESEPGLAGRRKVLAGVIPGCVLLWLHGRRVRYVLPVAPLAAVAAGIAFTPVFTRWFQTRRVILGALALVMVAGGIRIGVLETRRATIGSRATGLEWARVLPEKQAIYSSVNGHYWNACFYADRAITSVDDPAEIPPDAKIAIVYKDEIGKLEGRIGKTLYEGAMRRCPAVLVVELDR